MSNYRKYTPEEKIKIVKEYLSGESSLKEIGARYGYTSRKGFPGCYHRWIALYKEHGESAFYHNGNACYSKESKTKVVEEYIDGIAPAVELAAKYKISNASLLLKWVELCIIPIENLGIIFLKGRFIWQKQEEKPLLKNVIKSLNIACYTTEIIKEPPACMMFHTAKCIHG